MMIDDVHPEKGYMYEDDLYELLAKLHEDYGLKYTLFIPANWENDCPIVSYQRWMRVLIETSWIEIAAHGYCHQRHSTGGAAEFADFDELDERKTIGALGWIDSDFGSYGLERVGFKPPGWQFDNRLIPLIAERFSYMAVHFKDVGHKFECTKGDSPVYYDPQHDLSIVTNTCHVQDEKYNIVNNTIVIQSHIQSQSGNNSNLSPENIKNLRRAFDEVIGEFEPLFVKELIDARNSNKGNRGGDKGL